MNLINQKKFLFLLLGLFLISREAMSQTLVITRDDQSGFFSCIFSSLNTIEWCKKNNITPTIYWGAHSLYYQEEGYNGIDGNVWEYYFEPISDILVESTPGFIKKEYPLWKKYEAPDRSEIPTPFSTHYDLILNINYRKKIHSLIKKFIKVKPPIKKKINDFFNAYMNNKKIIGIHLRGTDKSLEVVSEATIETICKEANRIAFENGGGFEFFVATDEEILIDQAKLLLTGPVITYHSYRSLNGEPIHYSQHPYSKAKLGEEVLIEVILLSKCDHFVHTRSNVSSAVLFFNPKLKNKILY